MKQGNSIDPASSARRPTKDPPLQRGRGRIGEGTSAVRLCGGAMVEPPPRRSAWMVSVAPSSLLEGQGSHVFPRSGGLLLRLDRRLAALRHPPAVAVATMPLNQACNPGNHIRRQGAVALAPLLARPDDAAEVAPAVFEVDRGAPRELREVEAGDARPPAHPVVLDGLHQRQRLCRRPHAVPAGEHGLWMALGARRTGVVGGGGDRLRSLTTVFVDSCVSHMRRS